MKRTQRPVIVLFWVSCLVAAACGSVAPLGVDGGGGSGGTGQAGASGSAGTTGGGGTTGAAGTTGGGGTTGAGGMTGAAGTTGTAGTTGSAGTGGHGGMSGRVPQKHRAAAIACGTDRPAGTCGTATNVPDAGFGCGKDSDCTAGANGRCLPGGRIAGCLCSYDTCTTDADCATMGGPCECRPAAALGQGIVAPMSSASNVCKAGNCRVDENCGAGGYCSPSLGSCGNYSGVVGYYCHTPKDKCVDDADCAAQGGGDCRYDPMTTAWACATSQCAG